MVRGNRSSAIRRGRGAPDTFRRRPDRDVDLIIRDGLRVLRLVFRGVSLVTLYRERGETAKAFDGLRLGAESLAEAARRLGLGDRSTTELILRPIGREVGMLYDARTADRLMRALRRCFDEAKANGLA